jgi:ATP/maltotriose-dependent transcriptional regulator MalT
MDMAPSRSADWLVRTKFQAPLPRADDVPRPRLVAALYDACTTHALTLLSAPAGYGKTTLLTSLSLAFPRLPVAWLSLDEGDNELAPFLAALLAALQSVNPESAALLLTNEPPSLQRNPGAAARQIVGALVNDILARSPDDFILALDDLHVVNQPAIYAALDYMLERRPPQLHLIISTRHDPPLRLARLRAHGDLVELRVPDLRFTPDETNSFLNVKMSLGLGAGELAALKTRTEGWPAGLRLLAGSLDRISSASDRAAFVAHVARADHLVFEFLAEEVLARQEPDTKRFLLETSILRELTPTRCRAVTGRDDAGEVLQELYHRNLFLVQVPGAEDTFRYHALFAEFLQVRLRRQMPENYHELHQRAAESEALPARAIEHYLAAELWEAAAQVVERVGDQAIREGILGEMRGWIETLPPRVRESSPRLIYLLGVCLLYQGEHGVARRTLELAVQVAAQSGDRGTEGEALTHLATLAYSPGDLERGRMLIEQALACPVPLASRVELLMARARLSSLRREWTSVAADLDQALMLARETDGLDPLHAFFADLNPTFVVLPGGLERFEQACQLAKERMGEGTTHFHLAVEGQLALVDLWRGRSDSALERSRLALAQVERIGIGPPSMYMSLWMAAAGACIARAQYAVLDSLVQFGLRVYEQMELQDAAAPGLFYLPLRAYWWQGRLAEARHIYARIASADGKGEVPGLPVQQAMARGIMQIADRQYAQAESTLQRALELEDKTRLSVISGNVRPLLAHLYLLQERRREAVQVLAPLLEQCERERIPGLLLREGELITPLLRLAVEQGVHAAYAASLLDETSRQPKPIHVAETGETLTPREVEVLRLITLGASNQKIADELVISKHTAKIHVTNILGKLRVSSRTQAAARAHELHLV